MCMHTHTHARTYVFFRSSSIPEMIWLFMKVFWRAWPNWNRQHAMNIPVLHRHHTHSCLLLRHPALLHDFSDKVYVCMYYVRIHVTVYACMYVCIWTRMYKCACTRTHMHAHTSSSGVPPFLKWSGFLRGGACMHLHRKSAYTLFRFTVCGVIVSLGADNTRAAGGRGMVHNRADNLSAGRVMHLPWRHTRPYSFGVLLPSPLTSARVHTQYSSSQCVWWS